MIGSSELFRQDRDRRTAAREKTRQRLTKKDPSNQNNNFSLFDLDDKDDEEKDLGVRQQEDGIVIETV
jgi:hypothetical protein